MKKRSPKLPPDYTGPHPEQPDIKIVNCRADYIEAVQQKSPVCIYRQPPELKPDPELALCIKRLNKYVTSSQSELRMHGSEVEWVARSDKIPDFMIPNIEEQVKLFHEATGETWLMYEIPDPFLSWTRGWHKDSSTGQLYVFKGYKGTAFPLSKEELFQAEVQDISFIQRGFVHATRNFKDRVVGVVAPYSEVLDFKL